ncbi:MAG: hypothetical protein HY521_04140 [Proteobacteria bacterium]|nr:hypothetical protein [Pseudomonadota bacterium]
MAVSQKDEDEPIVTSALGETTHSELRLLYDESAESILFAKAQQWRTMGSTLLLYVALIAIAKVAPSNIAFVKGLSFVSFIASPAAIIILIIYQMWQHTEMKKHAVIEKHFSSLFRDVRAIKSRLEADIHRYALLLMMIVMIVIGNVVTFQMLALLAK